MLEYYDRITFIDSKGNMNIAPCTVHQTSVLKKLGFRQYGKYQEIVDCTILPKEFICPMSSVAGIMHKTKDIFSVHMSSASWFSKDELKNHIENFE